MSLERENKLRNKKANLQKLILSSVAITGVLAVGLVAPNVLWAMKKLGIFPHKRQKEAILSSKKRLLQKGLLEYDKKEMLRITPKGKRYLIIKTYSDKRKERKQKWDGKWRVLIFDIPESRKMDRESLRYALISIGFMKLQNSVWIYPYDCEDLITLLKADLEIDKDVLYMIVEALEYDEPVRKYFSLK